MASIELANLTFTAIDFETTGSVPGWPNEPWQIGLHEFTLGSPSAPDVPAAPAEPAPAAVSFSSLLRVSEDRPFNRFAPGRHSLLRHEIAAAPSFPELWEEIAPLLRGRPLVAHNIGTERTILRAAAPLDRLGPWIDTLKLSRALLPKHASYALEDLVPELGLSRRVAALAPQGTAPHDAIYDAIACAELLRLFFSKGLSCVPCA